MSTTHEDPSPAAAGSDSPSAEFSFTTTPNLLTMLRMALVPVVVGACCVLIAVTPSL